MISASRSNKQPPRLRFASNLRENRRDGDVTMQTLDARFPFEGSTLKRFPRWRGPNALVTALTFDSVFRIVHQRALYIYLAHLNAVEPLALGVLTHGSSLDPFWPNV